MSISLTTDFHSKAIMDPSSVQLFYNIVSITDGGLEGAGGYTPPGISIFIDSVVWSFIRSGD